MDMEMVILIVILVATVMMISGANDVGYDEVGGNFDYILIKMILMMILLQNHDKTSIDQAMNRNEGGRIDESLNRDCDWWSWWLEESDENESDASGDDSGNSNNGDGDGDCNGNGWWWRFEYDY